MIHAHSPQAKGRIERLFGTFQDRVIKEMRLAEITTMKEAKRFLAGDLPIYNRRFSLQPAQAADLHRPLPQGLDLNRALCIKTERVLRKDFTVAHRTLYQIQDNVRTARVTVEERLNGTMRITHQGLRLRYHVITTRQVLAHETPKAPLKKRRGPPSPDHPWRKTFVSRKKKEASAAIP